MKKYLAGMFLLFGALSVFAAKAPEFSTKVILTKAVNIDDQFLHILPGRPPVFPQVSKVVCGEKFFMDIVFFNAAQKNGSALLKGKITICAPGGKKEVITLKERSLKIKGDPQGVFLFPQNLSVMFEPGDPLGVHSFEVELTDRHSGKRARSSAKLEYVKSVAPATDDNEAFKKIGDYYKAPSPEYIIPAFRAYLKKIPAQKAKEKKNFNPLPQLALFYFCLKENPQYVDAFAEEIGKLTDRREKMMGWLILNFLSPEAAQKVPAADKKSIAGGFAANPFEIKKVSAPWHLDICWAEFFVRGTREPLLKIVDALAFFKGSISIPEFKKIAKPTQEEKRKFFNGLIAMAAQWSINSLAKQHALIRYYIEAALQRGEIKDPVCAAVAAKAVGINVRLAPAKK